MATLPGRLGTLTAHDVMTKDVIVLKDTDSLDQAIETLKTNHITGAPVVDAHNKLVGIMSVSDVVRLKSETSDVDTSSVVPLAYEVDPTTWDLFEKASLLGDDASVERVADRMSHQVTSVTEHASLVDVARAMCQGHWHRVPVVSHEGSLSGIISTMDVLAAMVNAADEPK